MLQKSSQSENRSNVLAGNPKNKKKNGHKLIKSGTKIGSVIRGRNLL